MGDAIRSLERRIWLACALILAGSAVAVGLGHAGFLLLPGVLCGAAVACGNFFLIRKILEKAFLREGEINKLFVVQYVLKFLGLIGLVYLIVRSGWFDILGFLLGLTSLFLGVLIEALWRSFQPAE
ncbi:MAG: ATP synthase subunit I [Treponema sp.]|nr:ATP synthase subunit I [Treponema sp.]